MINSINATELRKHRLIMSVVLLGVLSYCYAQDETSNSDLSFIKMAGVKEVRARAVAPSVPSEISALCVTLNIKNSKISRPSGYACWKILEAFDDQGTDLVLKSDTKSELARTSLSPEMVKPGEYVNFNLFGDAARIETIVETGTIPVEIFLNVSSLKSKRISRLRGEIQIKYGGVQKEVKIKNLASQIDKNVDAAVLTEAGINLKISKHQGKQSITFEYTGNVDALQHPRNAVVSTDGKTVNINCGGGSRLAGKSTYSYQLSTPLDDTLTLTQTVLVDQRITVLPFDFKDIELP
jgi:hypothetical protein